jgi:HEAT repeat protein
LVNFLKTGDDYMRRDAACTLGDIGPDARAALPALREALEDPFVSVREQAATALEKITR